MVRAIGIGIGMPFVKAAGGGFGPELVTNGTFDSGASWTASGNWTIGSGIASCTAGSFSALIQVIASIGAGRTFRIEFDLTRSAGSIGEIRMGGGTGASKVAGPYSTTGRISVNVVQSIAGTDFRFVTDTSFVGSVDNVSVREVF
jgi:hypothetical protein